MIAFAISAVLGLTSYAFAPLASYGAGGYPGPDALGNVPTYGSYLGNIPAGGHSPISYVCGLDAPDKTNNSPKYAIASINGQLAAFLPISTQFGCAEFVLYVSVTAGGKTAPCGYVYVSVNGGRWILVKEGQNELTISGIKHYHHVGAIFPFFVPKPAIDAQRCGTTTTTIPNTTIPNTTTPTTAPPTTIPGQTTTTAIPNTSTTLPNYHTTTSTYRAGTTTVPVPPNHSPGTVTKTITEITTLIAVLVGAGGAGAALGQLFGEVPEALVDEYATEIPPGGGLPYNLMPSGGAGALALGADEELPVAFGVGGTDLPAGGGIPVAGGVVDGGPSSDFMVFVYDAADGEEVILFVVEDPNIPAGGGSPTWMLIFSGGNEDVTDEQGETSGGGES